MKKTIFFKTIFIILGISFISGCSETKIIRETDTDDKSIYIPENQSNLNNFYEGWATASLKIEFTNYDFNDGNISYGNEVYKMKLYISDATNTYEQNISVTKNLGVDTPGHLITVYEFKFDTSDLTEGDYVLYLKDGKIQSNPVFFKVKSQKSLSYCGLRTTDSNQIISCNGYGPLSPSTVYINAVENDKIILYINLYNYLVFPEKVKLYPILYFKIFISGNFFISSIVFDISLIVKH